MEEKTFYLGRKEEEMKFYSWLFGSQMNYHGFEKKSQFLRGNCGIFNVLDFLRRFIVRLSFKCIFCKLK